jgi:heptosyltransferase-3
VWIVQNPLPCLPCQLEGCERHIDSYSRCLDELSIGAVMPAVDAALAMRRQQTSGAPVRLPPQSATG